MSRTGGDVLFQAILDNTEDDSLRLVYADWLEEHGQPDRADFIRVQIELTQLPDGDPRRPALAACEQALLLQAGARWLEEEWPQASLGDVKFERGFVVDLSLREANLEDADLEKFARRPRLGLLTALDLSRNRIGERGVQALGESPYLGGLLFLDLSENQLRDEHALPLGQFPSLAQLLWLYGNAPVQGEGWIGRHPFYFRARGNAWRFSLSEDPGLDPCGVYQTSERGFTLEGDYGDTPFAASYMPLKEAVAIIRRSAGQYRKARGAAPPATGPRCP